MESRLRVHAQRFTRGGGHLYVFALPLYAVEDFIPTPDPTTPAPGNRRVDLKHAREFGAYWLANSKWATPPLLLDTPSTLGDHFEIEQTNGTLDTGFLTLGDPSSSGIQILDGQHRVLGWTLLGRTLRASLRDEISQANLARDSRDAATHSAANLHAEALRLGLRRLRDEAVTVEILDSTDLVDHKQYFFDIAANARGISKSVTARFDSRDVINQVASAVSREHPLLEGLVEFETDRLGTTSPHLMTVAQVANTLTAALFGADGSIRQDDVKALTAASVIDVTERTFDALLDGFDDLVDVSDRTIPAAELRSTSLLGSVTMLRCLVGVFHELAVTSSPTGFNVDDDGAKAAVAFFQSISPEMGGPVPDALWGSGAFDERSSRGPRARRQEIKRLTERLVSLARAYRTSERDTTPDFAPPPTAPPIHDLIVERVEPVPEASSPPETIAEHATAWRIDWRSNLEFEDSAGSATDFIDLSGLYLNQISKMVLLTAEEEIDLALRIETGLAAQNRLATTTDNGTAQDTDLLHQLVRDGHSAKDEFLRANLRLVASIAWKYTRRGLEFLDVLQEGNLGLVRAVEKFDYTQGNKFSTYATWWIRQAITRGIADQGRTIRIPVHIHEQLNQEAEARKSLTQDLNRPPSLSEIATALSIEPEKARDLRRLQRPILSLDEPDLSTNSPYPECDDATFGGRIFEEEAFSAHELACYTDLQDQLFRVLDMLSERESGVISRRFGLSDGQPQTLDEIGKVYNVTRERIRQIEKIALDKLRALDEAKHLAAFLADD